ncbi:MAG: hypothetical protein MUC45_09910 [Actinomycetia bacterium]|jgi:hypothetical protein|nr:hypothetical protein [Actinomycetes bacterium]
MRVLLVVESHYGNTRKVADAVAEGLLPHDVILEDVWQAVPPTQVVDLLVVGGPTHAHGMSRAGTRRTAREDHPDGQEVHAGIREWLDRLPAVERRPAAAFDTRIARPRLLTGSASHGMSRRLRQRGYRLLDASESFLVEASEGPIAVGELERARAWGSRLAGLLAGR